MFQRTRGHGIRAKIIANGRLGSLDSIRGVSIALVLLFHFMPEIFPQGHSGVDLFFLLSGFLIFSKILQVEQLTWSGLEDFYFKRARRLALPSAALLLILFVISFFVAPVMASDMGEGIVSAALFVFNYWLYFDSLDYFSVDSSWKAGLHLWSLSVEAQFYLVAPFLTWIYLRGSFLSRLIFSFLSVSSLLIFIFWYGQSFFTLFSRIWIFNLGWLICRCELPTWVLRLGGSKVVTVLLNIFLLGTAFFVGSLDIDRRAGTFIIVLGGFFALLGKKAGDSSHAGFGFLAWLGKRSFSLYLVHFPILFLANYFSYHFDFANGTRTIFVLFISLCVGEIFYKLVELPSLSLVLRKRVDWWYILIPLLFVIFCGAILVLSSGFSSLKSKWVEESDSGVSLDFLVEVQKVKDFDRANLRFEIGAVSNPLVLVVGDSTARDFHRALNTADIYSIFIRVERACFFTSFMSEPCGEVRKRVKAVASRWTGLPVVISFSDLDFQLLSAVTGSKSFLSGLGIRLVFGSLTLNSIQYTTYPFSVGLVSTLRPEAISSDLVDSDNLAINFPWPADFFYLSRRRLICSSVDCSDVVVSDEPLMIDRVHLSVAGYEQLGRRLQGSPLFLGFLNTFVP